MEKALDPISNIAVLTTGHARIRPEHIGPTWKPMPLWLLTSRSWTDHLPVNVFVIEHREGVVLFDTGQDRAAVTDPNYFPKRIDRFVNARMAQVDYEPDETLEAGLSRLGYDPADVSKVIISHLHPDHVGGLKSLMRSEILISSEEWATLSRPMPESRGVYPYHIDLPGLSWSRITPEPLADPEIKPFETGHDIYGDGSLVVLPTPGHTPGSISLLVRRPGHVPLLLVGDLTYDDELLRRGELSGMCSRRLTKRVTGMVNALRNNIDGLLVLPSHDPASAERLNAAG